MTRLEQWQAFSKHMERYIEERTMHKYTTDSGIDLLSMFMGSRYGIIICLSNILKYALRLFNDSGKQHDIEKIAHYASVMWNGIQKIK